MGWCQPLGEQQGQGEAPGPGGLGPCSCAQPPQLSHEASAVLELMQLWRPWALSRRPGQHQPHLVIWPP